MSTNSADRMRTTFHLYAAMTGLLLMLGVLAASAGTAAAPGFEESERSAPELDAQWRWERRPHRFDAMIREPAAQPDHRWIREEQR